MTRDRDAFDMFQDKNRGRFGDSESESIRGNDSVRSNVVDVAMVIHDERPKSLLASSNGDIARAVWLPKSQVEIEETGALERKRNGRTAQPAIITLPNWLAKEKGLI